MSFELDQTLAAAAFARPGIDPRQWVSYGLVAADTPDAPAVRFRDEEGALLPEGPLITVNLQPSGTRVVCRVAGAVAGAGEADWYPYLEGDEVIVALPSGSERGGPVILGRLNQAIDEWPAIVAGQDAAANNFGFRRMRAPFIVETAEAYLIRSAKTGSQIGIDGDGQVIVNNGDRNYFMVSADAIALSNGDESVFLQLNFDENRITAAAGNARLELAASGESILFAPGALNIGTAGARGRGHAVTLEQVLVLLANFVCAGMVAQLFNPAVSATWTIPGTAAGVLNTVLAATVNGAVLPTPLAQNGAPGGNVSLLSAVFPGAISAAMSNPLPIIDPTGLIPGAAVPSLMF